MRHLIGILVLIIATGFVENDPYIALWLTGAGVVISWSSWDEYKHKIKRRWLIMKGDL